MSFTQAPGQEQPRLAQLQDAFPFTIGIIPSEIDRSLEVSIPILQELGVHDVELSAVDGVQLPEYSTEMLERIKAQLTDADLQVGVSGTEIFKFVKLGEATGAVLDHPPVQTDLAHLRQAIVYSRSLGAKIIRLYAFRRDDMIGLGNPSPILPDGGTIPDAIVEKAAVVLAAAGDLAGEAGMTLAVENVRSCWANTGVNLAHLVSAADHSAVRICWDAANDFIAGGNPEGTGYAAVRPYVVSVHFKSAEIVDPVSGLTAWKPIGSGAVNIAEQIRLLTQDGFDGLASLETHWKPEGGTGTDGTRRSFAGLLQAMREMARAGNSGPGN
jgi:sugar phosphate isomerase/epimerase